MALIYANAVNKRMGSQVRRKKSECCDSSRACSPCPASLKHKHSMEVVPLRKKSSTSSCLSSSADQTVCCSLQPDPSVCGPNMEHRPVQRSKTTCADIAHSEERSARRKRSSPAFHSNRKQTAKSSSSADENTKKQIKLKYNLEHEMRGLSVDTGGEIENRPVSASSCPRHRSASIEDNKERKKQRENAFSRIKRKFSNWRTPPSTTPPPPALQPTPATPSTAAAIA